MRYAFLRTIYLTALSGVVLAGAISLVTSSATAQGGQGQRSQSGPVASLSQILGRPTAHSITLSVLSRQDIDCYVESGTVSGKYPTRTAPVSAKAGEPVEIEITGLTPNTTYFYRLKSKETGQTEFVSGSEYTFHTQRLPGSSFTFGLQGDSHPERPGKMYAPGLYAETMRNVIKDSPDFYITLGDDFSIERLIEQNTLTQSNVDRVYSYQRGYLGLVGCASPLFLVNGNHEQAGRHWLDGTENNPGVMAGKARTRFFPLPAPDSFYSGDTEKVDHIGLLRDYYAWTWGDALFVVIDPYWHSPVGVDDGLTGSKPGISEDTKPESQPEGDNGGGGGKGKGKQGGGRKRGKGKRDLWQVTLGDDQYHWLAKTLSESKARYKFVFAHHVMGTGRGGVEEAGLYEWGGKDRRGDSQFSEKRPGWEMPIHDLFVKTGVTIFFQGHDHIYAHQELDGVVYQSTPNPADPTYTAFNREAYRSGTVLPNSGHLCVRVAPTEVKVEYIRTFLPDDKTPGQTNGQVADSYTVHSRNKF